MGHYDNRSAWIVLVAVMALLPVVAGNRCQQQPESESSSRLGHEGVSAGDLATVLDRIRREFRIDDEAEKQLLGLAFGRKVRERTTASEIAVVLFLPGTAKPERYEYHNPDQGFRLRWTRLRTTCVEKPVAVVTFVEIASEKLLVEEQVFYQDRGKSWQKAE